MNRTLIIPAAGRGTRLNYTGPKFLFPLCGKPLIQRIIETHRNYVDRIIVITSPEDYSVANSTLNAFFKNVTLGIQTSPTGMLDAILASSNFIQKIQPDRIWITWCDQVAVSDSTLDKLSRVENLHDSMIVPMVQKSKPYIHFDIDSEGRICKVLQAREGDLMPEVGLNDVGLFSLTSENFKLLEAEFSILLGDAPDNGTGERNFLPFIPWLAERELVKTIMVDDKMESLGINTPEDARRMERYLNGKIQRKVR